jgi:hypothetical protein
VIRFPNPSDSLTRDDLDALAGLTATASGKWLCETTRDDNWDLSAILVSGRTDSHEYAAYLIRRCDGKLVLIDARLAGTGGRWGFSTTRQASCSLWGQ